LEEDSEKFKEFKEYSYEDQLLIHFAVLNIAEEILENWGNKVLFYEENHRFAIIVNVDTPKQIAELRHLLQQVIENVNNILHISSTVGLARLGHNLLTEGKQAYEDARVAIEYKYYTGPDSVISYDDLQLASGKLRKGKMDTAHDEKLRLACNILFPQLTLLLKFILIFSWMTF
jgi:two-component system response regulator YesN